MDNGKTKQQRMNPLSYDPKHALNAICPYYTMFPLEYPFRILRKHLKEKPVVFDPFCGRGTTIYAARYLGLQSWGIDTSPIAVAIAKAKLAVSTVDDIMGLATSLANRAPTRVPETEFFQKAYQQKTLKQICAVREGLMALSEETDASILLRAAMLGCLHGPLSKRIEGAGYFSNQMPRTFATKPDYSVKYWKKRGLIAPCFDILNVLKRKLSRIKDIGEKPEGLGGHVMCADARTVNLRRKIHKNTSLVVTSPPYYGMRTYVEDQWLRMWFLGGPDIIKYGNVTQISHGGQETFIDELATVWDRIAKSEADKVDLYIRFGSVPSAKSDPRKIIKSSLEQSGEWKLISVRSASNAHEGKRQADQMGNSSDAALEYDFHALRT
jgi:hypothetical protein